ncbi:MAG: hypothetical protein ACOC7R_00225 [Planctomycetota bacterium]
MDRRVWIRRIEVARRRPGMEHPDRCPKLRVAGVPFALPPAPAQWRPRFDGDRVTLRCAGADDWPTLPAVLARVRRATKRGRLRLDPKAADGLLTALLLLARDALRCHYDVTDDELGDLLAVRTDRPTTWIADLIAWAQGLPTGGASEPISPPGRAGPPDP